jgi:DNA-binding CsgD family transcriptional regulator
MRAFERPRTEVSITLTPRQRQVLALVAHGRTNPQIAETLGISLAGAKWHVSEVISRLGVTSREEAAEYWREQNRLPGRFARAMRGLFGAGLLKTAAAGAAAATLSGGVVVAALVFDGGRDDITQTSPSTIFTEAEARERAPYIAGEYLKQTDIPQTTEVDGHPLSVDDLPIIELLYVPAGGTPTLTTVPATRFGTVSRPAWVAVLRRDGLQLPDMAPDDGRVTVTVTFEDGSGKVHGAGASRSNKRMDEAPQPPSAPPRDPALNERVTDYFPVMQLDAANLHVALSVYQTRGGEWCWAHSSDEAGGGASCGLDPSQGPSPDIFGFGESGPGTRQKTAFPGFVRGALSTRVAHVLLEFEHGDPVVVAATDFPSQSGLPWRAFASVLDPNRGELLAVDAVGQDGTRLNQFALPKRTKAPPYIVNPLDYINFSGSGDGKGGAFRLPPPAFPVKIALIATHDGVGPITADLVCDTGTTRVLDAAGPVGAMNGSLVVDVPPGATQCSFVVHADGAWSFQSK